METAIQNSNPWWKDINLINGDIRIEEFEAQPLKFYHPLLTGLKTDLPSILTLRGPRQVGKSTLIKLIIRHLLLKQKMDPRQIFFYSCDDIDDYHRLIQIIESYLDMVETSGLKGKPIHIFLDEISFVDEWPRGIKALYERGMLKKAFCLISGSNSYDLHHQAERLPGRRGKIATTDKVILPISFREYLDLSDFAFKEKLPEIHRKEILSDISVVSRIRGIETIRTDIGHYLRRYFLTGGYLSAINDFERRQTISQYIYETYLQWIRGDIVKLRRSETVTAGIFAALMDRMLSRIDWMSIANCLDVESHKTVADYVRLLEDFFIIKTVYQWDISRRSVCAKKMKKIYFLDPFIFWAVGGWIKRWPKTFMSAQESISSLEPALAEQYVFNSLNYTSDAEAFYEGVGFTTTSAGEEVDFITVSPAGKTVGVEVKFQTRYDHRDFAVMRKLGLKKGILITREGFDLVDQNFLALPLYAWATLK